jgi:hypothetical protein
LIPRAEAEEGSTRSRVSFLWGRGVFAIARGESPEKRHPPPFVQPVFLTVTAAKSFLEQGLVLVAVISKG